MIPSMNIVLTETSIQQINILKRSHASSEAEIIEQALILMNQDNADWEAIFLDDQVNHDLTEAAALLAVQEVRAYRNSKK
jgi:uncharacterized protein YqkB